MKVLFLTNGVTEPASRFRVLQLLPHFERAGVRCVNHSAYGYRYNAIVTTAAGPAYKLACRLKRAGQTLLESARYDMVFLQRTALPGSALAERLGARLNPRVVFDFDDSIFLQPDGREGGPRARAFDRAVRAAAHVIAGNSYLAARAGVPEKTTVIPTVIDTDVYRPGRHGVADGRVVIGWMGTASNFPYLAQIVPAIRRLVAESPQVVFRIVSNAPYRELQDEAGVEQIPWSEETEIPLLRSFDVGLMPLLDTGLARGKCGFKMIQYMGVGVPVVVSAVGANAEIMEGSGAGYLVPAGGDWYPALRALVDDAGRRRVMGAAAREHAVACYSVRSVVGAYLKLFESVAHGRSPDRVLLPGSSAHAGRR